MGPRMILGILIVGYFVMGMLLLPVAVQAVTR